MEKLSFDQTIDVSSSSPMPAKTAIPDQSSMCSSPSVLRPQNVKLDSSTPNGRDDLLAQIQAGTKLRRVGEPMKSEDKQPASQEKDQTSQSRKPATNMQKLDGIAGALARALQEHRKTVCISDESDYSDNNGSEWDD